MRWNTQFDGGQVLVEKRKSIQGEAIWNKVVHNVLSALHSIVKTTTTVIFAFVFFLP